MMTGRKKLWFLPVLLGFLFCLRYVCLATLNVATSDYIRLIIAYLPDVDNPAKFFVPDILTRAPLTYIFRLVNVKWFGYNTQFDVFLCVASLALGGLAFAWWAWRRDLPAHWYLAVLLVWFGLNKWEMLDNGTGWVCILSLSGFLFSYALLDMTGRAPAGEAGRTLSGETQKTPGAPGRTARQALAGVVETQKPPGAPGRRLRRLAAWFPLILTCTVTGVYCAAYIAVYVLICLILIAEELRKGRGAAASRRSAASRRGMSGDSRGLLPASRARIRTWRNGSVIAVISLGLFILCNHFAVWEYSDAYEGSVTSLFARDPLFFVRFLVKAFASDVVDRERLEAFVSRHAVHGGQAVMALGVLVIFLYLWALWMNLSHALWRQSVLPLALILYSGLSHLLILVSRTRFLDDHYGMSSRYAIQYEMGIIGILLTFAFLLAGRRTERGKSRKRKPEPRPARMTLLRLFCAAACLLILAGSLYTTVQEYQFGHYRKEFLEKSREVALNYRSAPDAEIKEYLQKDAAHSRQAMEILEENHLNVFRGR